MNKVLVAGKQLLQLNLGNAISTLTTKSGLTTIPVQPARYRNGNFFFGVFGNDKAFVWGNYNSSLRAYRECPVVSSIINRKAQAYTNGCMYVMNGDKKESKTPVAKQIRKLMNNPNPLQTDKQFRAQRKVYEQIYGWSAMLVFKPVGFEDDRSTWTLWNLPPWMIQVKDNTTTAFYQSGFKPFEEVRFNYLGRSTVLPNDSVFFFKENQISTGTFMGAVSEENNSQYLPDSKLFYLKENISTLTDTLRSRGTLTRERGPLWIISNDGTDSGDTGQFPIDKKVKKKMDQDFRRYGLMGGQDKAIITDAKIKLQTAGFDAQQLRLLENEVQDAKFIADGLNFPPYLLGLVDAKFDNQDIAERNMYSNAIIPDAESEAQQWTELFGLSETDLYVVFDYNHVPALQKNMKEQGQGRLAMNQALLIEWENNLLTWNRWQELIGEDTVVGMDLYYSDMIAKGLIAPANRSSYFGSGNANDQQQTADQSKLLKAIDEQQQKGFANMNEVMNFIKSVLDNIQKK